MSNIVEGVPTGYELVCIGVIKEGEWYVSIDGEAQQCKAVGSTIKSHVIIRPSTVAEAARKGFYGA